MMTDGQANRETKDVEEEKRIIAEVHNMPVFVLCWDVIKHLLIDN